MILLYITSIILLSASIFGVLISMDETNSTRFKVFITLLIISLSAISGSLYWENNADSILNGKSIASKVYIYENTEYVIWEDDTTHEYFVLGHNALNIVEPVYRIYLDEETVTHIDEMYSAYEESGAAFADMKNILLGKGVS